MIELRGIPVEWLSDDFREAYALLCDTVYFGVGLRDDAGRISGGGGGIGIHFSDERLLDFKTDVDRWLATEGASVRAWSASRARARAGGAGSPDRHRGDLARAGGSRHHAAERDD